MGKVIHVDVFEKGRIDFVGGIELREIVAHLRAEKKTGLHGDYVVFCSEQEDRSVETKIGVVCPDYSGKKESYWFPFFMRSLTGEGELEPLSESVRHRLKHAMSSVYWAWVQWKEEIISEKSKLEVKETEGVTPMKEAVVPGKETQGGKQEVLAGIEAPPKEDKQKTSNRTWGEVRLMKGIKKTIAEMGIGLGVPREMPSDTEVDVWVDMGVEFPSGSTQEAEQHLQKMMEDDGRGR